MTREVFKNTAGTLLGQNESTGSRLTDGMTHGKVNLNQAKSIRQFGLRSSGLIIKLSGFKLTLGNFHRFPSSKIKLTLVSENYYSRNKKLFPSLLHSLVLWYKEANSSLSIGTLIVQSNFIIFKIQWI